MTKETFFVVQVPAGTTPRRWGRMHAERLGFDYDNNSSKRKQVLVWPNGVTAWMLAQRLRAAKVMFMTFTADPKKMFGIE
jgi:hypothetical protein